MTRDDYVIVCGDFGVWHPDNTEKWWFRWLSEKNFTLLFVDGNHENFDRLYSDEFEIVDFHGGKAHRICENVYHLMRGYVFELCVRNSLRLAAQAATTFRTEFLSQAIINRLKNWQMIIISGRSVEKC